MIAQLENPLLAAHLDCDNFLLRNCGTFDPVPAGLLDINDSRLSDPRTPVAGSVTDQKVSATAGIVQSKLSLDSTMPASWIGTGAAQAAQGNLVERVASKGVSGGYTPLDSNARIPVAHMPSTGPQAGTVTKVELSVPLDMSVSGNPIITAGSFSVTWNNQPDNTWFGLAGIVVNQQPSHLAQVIPDVLMPELSATKITSGIFDVPMLPVVIGMGIGHAAGVVPDPGDETTGHPADYLGRDGYFHHFDKDIQRQPTVPEVMIVFLYQKEGVATLALQEELSGASVFYRIIPALSNDFTEATGISPGSGGYIIQVADSFTVQCYAAKAGYNNSPMTQFTVQPMVNV